MPSVENSSFYNRKPEIQSMQKWIEEDVIGKSFCPPMVKLAQQYRVEEGIDWEELSVDVPFISYYDSVFSNPSLKQDVSRDYSRFIEDAAKGKAPLSIVIILPDFPTNKDYDKFIFSMKANALQGLISKPQVIRSAYDKLVKKRDVPKIYVDNLFSKGNAGIREAASILTENTFRPVFFYGQMLTDADVADFPTVRGDLNRQKVLARSPYYAIQVVNILDDYLTGNMDRKKLAERNTKLALGTDLQENEKRIEGFRRPD